MSSAFDQAYDEMALDEVICRLPGELAIRAMERRIKTPKDVVEFFKYVTKDVKNVEDLSVHINSILYNTPVKDIVAEVGEEFHLMLFTWMNKMNLDRFKNEGKNYLPIKLLFNMAKEDDIDILESVLDRILSEQIVKRSAILSVLDKINHKHFYKILETVIKDKRPIVKSCVLSVTSSKNKKLITDNYKLIGLKALVQIPKEERNIGYINKINFDLFTQLKPLERLTALEIYFTFFPKFQKVHPFDPMPSAEEFDAILFAGCCQHYDLVAGLHATYKDITENTAPPKK